MAFLGGKSVTRRSVPRGAAAAACLLVSVVGLSACEYADTEPLPGTSTSSLPTLPGNGQRSPSAQDEARQRELIADVEAQLGRESDRRVASMLGGMGRTGASVMGLVPDDGRYLVRAACSPRPGLTAKLTVSQAGTRLLDVDVSCGEPFESILPMTAGRVTAEMAPTSRRGPSAAAVRIETAPAEPTAVPAPADPASSP